MKTSVLCGLVVVASSVVWAAGQVTPLDVKLGLWETTWTGLTSGQIPLPPEALANLTPEQRARLDAAMKARAGQNNMRTNRSCVTKEKLTRDLFSDEQKKCTRTVVTSTSRRLEMRLQCEDQGMKSVGTFKVESSSSEEAKGTMEMVTTGGGRTMNINSSFTAKWIGPDCGSVK